MIPQRGPFTRPLAWIGDKMSKPVETKVLTGAGAGGLAAATITPIVLWTVGVLGFDGPATAASADIAILSVPWPVTTFLSAVVVSGGGFLGGWIGRHTRRPDVVDAD